MRLQIIFQSGKITEVDYDLKSLNLKRPKSIYILARKVREALEEAKEKENE